VKATRDRRASRWDEHRALRRTELVDAALLAIREHGAGVGMDDVAARAGTSKTVVYRHYTDRAGLYVAVCTRVAEVLARQVQGAMDAATHPREKAAAGIGAYLRLIEHDPEVYRFVVRRPLVDRPLTEDPVADLTQLVGDRAAAVIAAQLSRAGRDTAAATTWGHAVVGLGGGGVARGRPRRGGISREVLTAQLTDLAWAGLSGVVASPVEEKNA